MYIATPLWRLAACSVVSNAFKALTTPTADSTLYKISSDASMSTEQSVFSLLTTFALAALAGHLHCAIAWML
jgi:hypothetical protein